MIRLRRPSDAEIERALRSADGAFSYPEVGATAPGAPPLRSAIARGYDVDRYEHRLGRGRDVFEHARAALAAWRHLEIPWLELHGARHVKTGQVVATLVSVAGLWFLNPCRVVYADLSSDPDSACFAYGTLAGHPERGEERFRVWLDPATEEVRYEIMAFSRPAIALVRVGRPLARRIQRRFGAASGAALLRAATDVPAPV